MKRKLLLIMLSLIFLKNAVKAQVPTDDAPIKIDTLLLTMPLVVKDKDGRNVTGLKKEDFSIIQNGDKQNIEYFFNEESPMNVFYPIVFKTKFYAQARQRAANNNRKPLPMEILEFLATETTGRFYENFQPYL